MAAANAMVFPILAMLPQIEDEQVLRNVAGELQLNVEEDGQLNILRLILNYLIGPDFADLEAGEGDERVGRVSLILTQHMNQLQQQQHQNAGEDVNAVQVEALVPVVEIQEAAPPFAVPVAAPVAPAVHALGPGLNPAGGGIGVLPPGPAIPVVPPPMLQRHGVPLAGAGAVGGMPNAAVVPAAVGAGGGALRIGRLHEFKMRGHIGRPGEEGKLDFFNISYQISSALARGYSRPEICSAILAACDPGDLKGYFERLPNLNLDFVVERLRDWFHVKDAASVMTGLQSAIQQDGESEMQFCMRLMGMRQDVLSLSAQEEYHYDPALVQVFSMRSTPG